MANNRPKMDRADRAKQFMPFDALKGFREALAEKEKLFEEQKQTTKIENIDGFVSSMDEEI